MKKNPMRKISKNRIAVAFVLLFTAHTPLAWAEEIFCSAEMKKAAAAGDAAQMKTAEAHERAGRLKQAYEAVSDSPCGEAGSEERYTAMRQRIGLKLGQQDEKQGRLEEAFVWYKGSGNDAEADLVKMKQVNVSPRDRNLISNAIDYFKYSRNDQSVAELRQLAAKNAEIELANEEKAFAAHKESFDELGSARDWYYLVGKGADKKVRVRAEQRGDILFKEDIYRHLENARSYFGMAEAKSKKKAVQDKALRLAQEHEKKGEITQATNFYNLADAGDKGVELEARTEAQHKKSEEKRQKKFTKEQDDLEKELGL